MIASLGVIGTGAATGSSTIDIPVAVTVPRSDPTLGASIVIVYLMIVDGGPAISSVADDAATDPFYSTHLYTSGMNPWEASPGDATWRGLCLNPLTSGLDTITVTMGGTSSLNQAIAVAYTGAQVNNQSSPSFQVPNLPPGTWFDSLAIPGPFGRAGNNPPGSPTSRQTHWSVGFGGPTDITLDSPAPLTYPTWSIMEGALGVYFVLSSPFSTVNPGDFVPTAGWTEIASILNVPAPSPFTPPSYSLAIFEKPLAPPELDDDLSGTWTTADSGASQQAYAYWLIGGLGPVWAFVPPPPFTGPVFSHRHRAAG